MTEDPNSTTTAPPPRSDRTKPPASTTNANHRSAAGLRRRATAYLLDLVLVSGATFAVATRIGRSREERAVVAALFATVAGTLYHVLLEGATGRTAGKAVTGIAVVGEDGTPCSYRAAAIRTALRLFDWLPAGYLVGSVSILLTERSQRLGDLVANTVVVERRVEEEA